MKAGVRDWKLGFCDGMRETDASTPAVVVARMSESITMVLSQCIGLIKQLILKQVNLR